MIGALKKRRRPDSYGDTFPSASWRTHVPSAHIIVKRKSPLFMGMGFKKAASTYSPTLKRAVPSAQAGLTSLFGMGRGGPCCYRHLKRWIQ